MPIGKFLKSKISALLYAFLLTIAILISDVTKNIIAEILPDALKTNIILIVSVAIVCIVLFTVIEYRKAARNQLRFRVPILLYIWILMTLLSLAVLALHIMYNITATQSLTNISVTLMLIFFVLFGTWQTITISRAKPTRIRNANPAAYVVDFDEPMASPYNRNSNWNQPNNRSRKTAPEKRETK